MEEAAENRNDNDNSNDNNNDNNIVNSNDKNIDNSNGNNNDNNNDNSNDKYKYYTEILQKTGKIEKVALLDFSGELLISSEGFELGSREINSILRAIESQYLSLMKLKIRGKVFTCFRNDSMTKSLIGRAENDVISVYKCVEFIVVGISDPDSPGSCIYEMQKFVKRCFRLSSYKMNG